MSPECKERLYARVKELRMNRQAFNGRMGKAVLLMDSEEATAAQADDYITVAARLVGLYPEYLRTGTGPRLVPDHEQ